MPTDSPPPRTLAVFGAGGQTGRQFVAQAHARGHAIRAFEPSWPEDDDLPAAIDRRRADVLNDDLGPELQGCDAVVSCIGVGLTAKNALNPPPLYTEGTDAMIRGMKAAGIARIVVISASFVATYDRGPLHFRAAAAAALSRIFDQMGEMEHRLRSADGLDWTAVRPGWLMAGELTADYVVNDEVIPEDLIRTRHADLAHFMLSCVENDAWVRRTPAIARAEEDAASGPLALAGEMAS